MKRIVRLTEADLVRIVKRVIKEDNGDVLNCLVKATGLTVDDLIKLAPCLEMKNNPTDTTKIQACLTAAIPVAQSKIKIDIFDPVGTAKRITELATKIMGCATSQASEMNNVSMNENYRRFRRR